MPKLPRAAMTAALALGLIAALSFAHDTPRPGAVRARPAIEFHERAGVRPFFFPRGHLPPHIQAYLRLSSQGEGETIAIVSAYHAPTLIDDFNAFSFLFGLPGACGTEDADPADCAHVTVSTAPGTRVNEDWALESSLDVQWAHAVAPRANILLIETRDDELRTLMAGVQRALAEGATIVSMSWGIEEEPGQQRYDHICAKGAACVVAAGNAGHSTYYPAASPNTIAVGGTSIHLTSSGEVASETAWAFGSGGSSALERRPRSQAGVIGAPRRGVPDVSFHAEPERGFAVYDSLGIGGHGGWFMLGGTSAGAPQWAGIIAAANSLRVREGKARLTGMEAQQALYSLGGTNALFDITEGSNGSCGVECTAGPGYDFVTGLGSPRSGIDVALAATP